MNSVLSRSSRIPLLAKALIAAVGFAVLLSLGLPAPGHGHRARRAARPQPASFTPPRPESRPTAGPLTLTVLSIGPEPKVYASGRRMVSTFITDDGESCHLVATARLAGGAGPQSIHWAARQPET